MLCNENVESLFTLLDTWRATFVHSVTLQALAERDDKIRDLCPRDAMTISASSAALLALNCDRMPLCEVLLRRDQSRDTLYFLALFV